MVSGTSFFSRSFFLFFAVTCNQLIRITGLGGRTILKSCRFHQQRRTTVIFPNILTEWPKFSTTTTTTTTATAVIITTPRYAHISKRQQQQQHHRPQTTNQLWRSNVNFQGNSYGTTPQLISPHFANWNWWNLFRVFRAWVSQSVSEWMRPTNQIKWMEEKI